MLFNILKASRAHVLNSIRTQRRVNLGAPCFITSRRCHFEFLLNIGCRYDLEFLLQFQSFCKAKPTTLRRLDDIGLDPKDQDHMSRRGPPNPNRKGSGAGPPSRQGAIGLVGKDAASFSIGGLATAGVGKLSSEERFALSPASSHVALVSGASGVQNAVKEGSTPMTRTASQADPGAIAKRTRTRTKRNKKSKVPGGEQQNHDGGIRNQQVMGLEPGGAPVQTSAKRRNIKALPVDAESPEVALRKIKCLVNKLTIEKFDSISNQIIAWINKLENDTHGYTLIQITNLVVQQAMDEPMWSEMFARLCRKIMEKISSNVKDDSIKDNAGKAIAGGQLFPNHLLSCCKENFERRWGENDATDRSKEDGRDDEDNVALTLLEGFYAGQKAKQPGLGLVKFIGELFKLQMLKEYTIHNCVKMLLGNVDKPDEEKIEPLCKLLAIVGGILDKPKACTVLDVYFSCMKGFTKSPNVNARMQSMLLVGDFSSHHSRNNNHCDRI